MRHPIHVTSFNKHELPLSQLNRPLSHNEASGQLSRDIGLLPSRFRQIPMRSRVSEQSVLFVHPAVTTRVPSPSERRPAPQSPRHTN